MKRASQLIPGSLVSTLTDELRTGQRSRSGCDLSSEMVEVRAIVRDLLGEAAADRQRATDRE
jgi:hypothetical protein